MFCVNVVAAQSELQFLFGCAAYLHSDLVALCGIKLERRTYQPFVGVISVVFDTWVDNVFSAWCSIVKLQRSPFRCT